MVPSIDIHPTEKVRENSLIIATRVQEMISPNTSSRSLHKSLIVITITCCFAAKPSEGISLLSLSLK